MAVPVIPQVTNWTVTPQNGQAGYFTLMNTWLGQSTTVIQSLYDAIEAQNTANEEINDLAIEVQSNKDITVAAKDEAVGALAILSAGAIDDTNIATNKAFSNSFILNSLLNSRTVKTTPVDADIFAIGDSTSTFSLKKLSWANIKATMKAYTDTLYVALTGNQTIAGTKTFTSSPLVPTATTGDNSTKVATTAFARSQDLGIGQNYVNETANRLVKTTYTNSSEKPIFLFVTVSSTVNPDFITVTLTPSMSTGGGTPIVIRGVGAGSASTGGFLHSSFIVPPDTGYSISTNSGTVTLNYWGEMK